MARLAAYIFLILGGLAFWVIELLFNYWEYASHDPFGLEYDYQKAYILNRTPLIFAELLFPLGMVIAFLLMLVFKIAARSVRIALGFVLFVCLEFWMWRTYVFKGRMAILYLQNDAKDTRLTLPDNYQQYMIAFGLAFLAVMLLREYALGTDPDDLNERLAKSLKNRG